ncbi:glycosyltransferase family 4 protein [Paenibacillus oenotherae]|uniref:Glycosyltransferase family 4 protein n=1 Tax=Paenibacillus oenotherae TaxID=1435645 RepID=A0ABS7D3Q7_9BACL|nr:glycosyltransferase family 4 protein [Paenibacillus oenotherae]MBW7474528.1 glycosyltransferase family 4 protein [Paenibacillus oenotherae]
MKRSKPRMLVFSHICSPQYVTGAEKLLLFMIRELLPAFSCTVVVPNEGVVAEQARGLGIPVIIQEIPLVVSVYLALPHMMNELEEKKRDKSWRELFLLLHRQRPDIVLVNTCVHPLPAIAARTLDIPVVWAIMETLRETPHTGEAAALIEQHADYVVGISESTAAPLRTPGLLPKTTIIHPSWEHSALLQETWPMNRINRRKQLGISDGHKLIGYISSSIFEAKGLEHFMQMAVEVAERFPGAIFLIVGNPVDNGYFERCLDHARSRNLMERFRWIRFEEQIETIYPAMDIVVVPSLTSEGFGMTALEGMVFGKPIVVYGSGGLAEIAGATGNEEYAAPTGDVEGLFSRVCKLLGDERNLLAVGERNAATATQVFGVAAYREKLRNFVAGLALHGYAPPRLVRGTGPTVYLFQEGMLRPFGTEKAFLDAGHRFEEVRGVPDEWIAALPQGVPIGGAAALQRRKPGKRIRRGKAGRHGRGAGWQRRTTGRRERLRSGTTRRARRRGARA